jgi:hypothetical protein
LGLFFFVRKFEREEKRLSPHTPHTSLEVCEFLDSKFLYFHNLVSQTGTAKKKITSEGLQLRREFNFLLDSENLDGNFVRMLHYGSLDFKQKTAKSFHCNPSAEV